MNANSKTLTHKRTLHHPVQHETKLNLQFPLSKLNSEEMLKSGSGTEYDLNRRKEKSEKKLVIKSLFLAFGIKMKILFKGKWKKGMSVNANVNMSILYSNAFIISRIPSQFEGSISSVTLIVFAFVAKNAKSYKKKF